MLFVLDYFLKHAQIKKKTFSGVQKLCLTDLEVRALTQDIMADVQMVLSWWLGCFTLDLPVCCRHTQLTGLGERLKVVGRHRPELKVWVVSKQPAVDHNICLAGSEWCMLPLEIKSMIPFIILQFITNEQSFLCLPSHAWLLHTDLPFHPPSTSI